MALVLYTGPDGQANAEVGRATGGGDMLEPGAIYDVPSELAARLVGAETPEGEPDQAGSVWFSRVRSLNDLTLEQLQTVAQLRDIDGRSSMNRKQLIAALRGDTAREGDSEDGGSE